MLAFTTPVDVGKIVINSEDKIQYSYEQHCWQSTK